jgi:hypothetical protein
MHLSLSLPVFRPDIEIVISKGSQRQVVRYTYTGEVPKQLMDAYQTIVGNGLAKVSVSADMGTKDYGNGVSATVFVSLTCNQDQQTMLQAIELAGSMARWAARDQHAKTESEYKAMLGAAQAQQGGPSYG